MQMQRISPPHQNILFVSRCPPGIERIRGRDPLITANNKIIFASTDDKEKTIRVASTTNLKKGNCFTLLKNVKIDKVFCKIFGREHKISRFNSINRDIEPTVLQFYASTHCFQW